MSGKPCIEKVLSLVDPKVRSLATALYPASGSITIKPIVSEAIKELDTTPHAYAAHVSFYLGSSVKFTNDNCLWLDVQRVTANVNVSDSVTKNFVMKQIEEKEGYLDFSPQTGSCGDLPYVA